MHKISLSIALFIVFFALVIGFSVKAQTPDTTDLGIQVSINDTNVQNGDVVCSGSHGYTLCNNEYDSSIYGVVDSNPTAAVTVTNLTNPQIVISKGETTVRVSSANGNIKVGDFITSSKTAGVAELASKEGFVVGTALEAYSASDKTAVGTIKMSINIHPSSTVSTSTTAVRQNLIELLRNGLSGLGVDPISALRYILASGVVIASLVTGFIYFGRIAQTGVSAIGRNPLAGGRIEASVVINILIMLIIVGAGLGIAYLILAI